MIRVLGAATLSSLLTVCISRSVDFVPFLPPTATADLDELVARVNEWARVNSLVLRADLQFETVEEAEKGRGRKYHTAQGRLLLERPSSIRIDIEAPVLSAGLAEMASDGSRFQLLIHPPEYRAFIEGSNEASYEEDTRRLKEDPELTKAGPLVNIRPQHVTDALLIAPIDATSAAFLHEEQAEEDDLRPGAAKDARVRKSYYVVTAVRQGERVPWRQFWFSRQGEVSLARQRVFDGAGLLVTEVRYAGYRAPDPSTGARIADRIRIERPHDEYALVLTLRPEGIEINRDLPETAFAITVPPEWGDRIRRIDLDERARPRP
jgi:hypothetical protein